MPPKRINKLAGTGILLGNACCFCQRPADDATPGGLGALIQCTSGNTALKYHEACAAYSMVIAMKHPKHGSIQEWLVSSEAQRGSNVICVLCRKPGATIKCSGKSCPRSYHLPCAREAAMNTNANLRVDEAMRPVFAALDSNSSNEDSSTVNNSGRLALACSDHACEAIKNPLREPAGLWFDKCGGWDCQCPALASPEFLMSKRSHLEGEENNFGDADDDADAVAAAAAGTSLEEHGEGSTDQNEADAVVVVHVGSTAAPKLLSSKPLDSTATPVAAAPAAAAAAAAPTAAPSPPPPQTDTTFDIPNHIWEVSACVTGPLPPLRPKEGRVLGVTLSAPVFQTYRKTISLFLVAAKKNPQLRHIVPLQNSTGSINKKAMRNIARSVEKTICSAAKVDSIKKVKIELPDIAPCHSALEPFFISKDDPREGLAAESGALGVRVRSNAGPVKPYELLGIYGGLQLFYNDHNRLLDDEQLAKSVGLRCKQQLATKVESYTADEEQAQHADHFEEAVPEVEYLEAATGGWFKHHHSWLLTTAFLYGNMTCLINNPTLDPFRSATDGHPAEINNPTTKNSKKNRGRKCENQFLMAEPNCKMMSCLIRGWPFTILVSTAQINPGQELLYLYNGKESHEAVTMDGYWSTLKDRIALETDALKALQREEELRQNWENERREKEQKDREIAELKKLLMVRDTFTSSGYDRGSVEVATGTFTAGGGSAVIGDVRRKAQASAAAAVAAAVADGEDRVAAAADGGGGGGHGSGSGDATAAKLSEDIEIRAMDNVINNNNNNIIDLVGDGGGGGSGVTTTPNGELSVLTGSVSTEDLNGLIDKEELQATGEGKEIEVIDMTGDVDEDEVENGGGAGADGGGGVHLAKQHSLVFSNGAAAAAGADAGGGVDADADADAAEDIKRRLRDATPSAVPVAAAAVDPVKTAAEKRKHEENAANKKSRHPTSRSRSRSRDRTRPSKRRSYSPDRRYNEDAEYNYERRKVKSSPGRGRGRSPGRGRGRGRCPPLSKSWFREDDAKDYRGPRDSIVSRGYDDDYTTTGGKYGEKKYHPYSRSRSRSPDKDLRAALHRSKPHWYEEYYTAYKHEDEYKRHGQDHSRSRSRDRSRERERSRDRDRSGKAYSNKTTRGGDDKYVKTDKNKEASYFMKDKIPTTSHKSIDSSEKKKNKAGYPPPLPSRRNEKEKEGVAKDKYTGSRPTVPLASSFPPPLPNPESLTMTVPLIPVTKPIVKSRVVLQATSDSMASLPPAVAPVPTAPAAVVNNYHHHSHPQQMMSFVIPATLSDIPKADAQNSKKSRCRPRKKTPSQQPSSRRSPRPVRVGDVHSHHHSQDNEFSLNPSSSRPQSQPSMSDAPSCAWHQIISPRKSTRSWQTPDTGNGGSIPSPQQQYRTSGTAVDNGVYDPEQAYAYLQKDIFNPPPYTCAFAAGKNAVAPIPWGYVDMPEQGRKSGDNGKPGSKKGWYD